MGSTVIFTHGGGRFGNQLLQFGHLIALTEDQRHLSLVNCSFWPYGISARHERKPVLFLRPPGRPPVSGTALARSF